MKQIKPIRVRRNRVRGARGARRHRIRDEQERHIQDETRESARESASDRPPAVDVPFRKRRPRHRL